MTTPASGVRPARATDLEAVLTQEGQGFDARERWSAQSWADELAADNRIVLVVGEPVAGVIAVQHVGAVAELNRIVVGAGTRRTGLGRRLLAAGIAAACEMRVDEMLLEVRADNEAARALYAAFGFVDIARRKNYYGGGVDAVVMRLDLEGTMSDESRNSRKVPSRNARKVPSRNARKVPSRNARREPSRNARKSLSRRQPLILGVESSCDETGFALVRGRILIANEVASSVDQHERFGGVVPEVASRAHLEALVPTLRRACAAGGVELDEVDAIAVTAGPGLMGALVVGVSAAKALALALDKPLYGVNHLAAHVAVDLLDSGDPPLPAVALLVSGGHTSLLEVDHLTDPGGITELGATIDDAAGEAYDKVARLLGLGYPGGPVVDRLAAAGDPTAIRFPRGLTARHDLQKHRFGFSFSGLKTAVARWVETAEMDGREIPVADVCASFQEAVCDVLTAKAVDACRHHGVSTLILGGGVAANSRLRSLMTERCAEHGIAVRRPRPGLCTDNGAMIAALGAELVRAGRAPSGLEFGAESGLPVTRVLV